MQARMTVIPISFTTAQHPPISRSPRLLSKTTELGFNVKLRYKCYDTGVDFDIITAAPIHLPAGLSPVAAFSYLGIHLWKNSQCFRTRICNTDDFSRLDSGGHWTKATVLVNAGTKLTDTHKIAMASREAAGSLESESECDNEPRYPMRGMNDYEMPLPKDEFNRGEWFSRNR
ncbi:hypothetical protein DOTSEDRAFT_38294 [Dothistroma septosporum NZE10]|uniref:Uncharacterized protein n=1 Tax=Dothistroma septosporum (strain NZE10 / CBS 128990) TaxID=675120 RepID=N1PCQ8_DOTSN|nr:hypothetical protein DOTSEDRAFT_38294 [Dothistroma septosporum NZE10]